MGFVKLHHGDGESILYDGHRFDRVRAKGIRWTDRHGKVAYLDINHFDQMLHVEQAIQKAEISTLDAIAAMLGGVEVVKQNLTTDATIIRRFCDHCGIGTAQDGAGCLNCRALKAIARGAKSPDHQPNSPQIDNVVAGAIEQGVDDAIAGRTVPMDPPRPDTGAWSVARR